MHTDFILNIFKDAVGKLGISDIEIDFEKPKIADHGDLSTNIALKLAKPLKKKPGQIAQDIIDNLEYNRELISSVEIAGPGFINIKFSEKYYTNKLKQLAELGETIGKSDIGKGIKVNVEYVSVNPTGLLHLGHGRNASIGDTVANLYEWMGYEVTREYYFNNAGSQMAKLAFSIYSRYMQLFDSEYPFPEDGYHGDYVNTIAEELYKNHGDSLKDKNDDNLLIIRKFGEGWCFARIKETLVRLGVRQDVYYNEDSLYSDGKIDKIISDFKNLGLAYEKDNALWLQYTKLGLEDDRVIVKSTGEPTYRLPDMAYHREKFERGFDICVDIFGSDHIATVPDVLVGIKALGYDTSKVIVLVHQFVTLTEGGEQVKMSKRSGKVYTLDDLIDETSADVVRFFLLMRGISTHLEFDLELAREQGEKNPVFYLQYAHARICSIFRKAAECNLGIGENVNYDILNNQYEIDIIKRLSEFSNIVKQAATRHEPHIIAEYLRELASAYHIFYHNCSVLSAESSELINSRLKLSSIVKDVIANGLKILGISTPEYM
jgi:arginyl-tRNA synthetase